MLLRVRQCNFSKALSKVSYWGLYATIFNIQVYFNVSFHSNSSCWNSVRCIASNGCTQTSANTERRCTVSNSNSCKKRFVSILMPWKKHECKLKIIRMCMCDHASTKQLITWLKTNGVHRRRARARTLLNQIWWCYHHTGNRNYFTTIKTYKRVGHRKINGSFQLYYSPIWNRFLIISCKSCIALSQLPPSYELITRILVTKVVQTISTCVFSFSFSFSLLFPPLSYLISVSSIFFIHLFISVHNLFFFFI